MIRKRGASVWDGETALAAWPRRRSKVRSAKLGGLYLVGTRIGKYTITGILASGGMGAVYKAVHEEIGRQAAIKILLPEFVKNEEVVKRFLNEARAVNLIRHRSLVEIYDTDRLPDGSACLIMELLDGETLAKRIETARGRIPTRKILRVAWQLADVLNAVHERGIVHRDLKPGNAMLVKDSAMPDGERVKLLDFGIAKLAMDSTRLNPKTGTGVTMGTVYYMSPEQCLGAKEVDGKADVYSLGVMLFEMLTGEVPFDADNPLVVMNLHLIKPPPRLADIAPNVPTELVTIVESMLHKERDQRPTMRALTESFHRLSLSPALQDTDPDDQTLQHPPFEQKDVFAPTNPDSLPQNAKPVAEPAASTEAKPVPTVDAPSLSAAATSRQPTGDTVAATTVRPESPTQQITSRKPLLVAALLGASLLVGLGLLIPWFLRSWPIPQPVAVHPVTTQPSTTPVSNPLVVKWNIQSTPPGADVVRQADQRVLGVTPWRLEREGGAGDVALVLRKDGYVPRTLSLPGDQSVERSERLDPLPTVATSITTATPTRVPAAKGGSATTKKKPNKPPGETSKTSPSPLPVTADPAQPPGLGPAVRPNVHIAPIRVPPTKRMSSGPTSETARVTD